jgi:hypothetical protein
MMRHVKVPATPALTAEPGEHLLYVLREDLRLKPFTIVPPHAHPGASEVYTIAAGTGVVEIEGQSSEVAAGDVVHVPPGATHTIRVGAEGLDFGSFMAFPGLLPFLAYRAKRFVQDRPALAALHARLRGRPQPV